MAQSLLSKYVWIIDTIYKADRISFKELNSLWLDSEISEGVEIPKRTFDNWRYIIRKTKCFDFWERNVLFPKTKRSFFRTPTLPFSA